MTSQTTTQEDLLQPGHIVKERWKVVCILTDFRCSSISKFWLPVVLNSLFLEKGTEDKYLSHFPPKNRPLII